MVDVMLDRLASEDRDEVCSRVFTTDSVQNRLVDKGPDYVIKRYLGIDYRGIASNLPDGFNVLALYFIEQFDKDQLKQFVKFISSVNKNYRRNRCSIWVDYINKACNEDGRNSHKALEKFMKCVSDKLGKTATKKLVLAYDDISGDVITSAASSGCMDLVDAMLAHMTKEDRYEIRDNVFTTEGLVSKLVRTRGSHYWIKHFLALDKERVARNVPDGFNVLCLYFVDKFDKAGLKEFVEFIRSDPPENDFYWSIWGYYGDNIDGEYPSLTYSIKAVAKFLSRVSQLLGKDTARQLVLFDDKAEADENDGGIEGPVFIRIKNRGFMEISNKMLSYMSDEDKKEMDVRFSLYSNPMIYDRLAASPSRASSEEGIE